MAGNNSIVILVIVRGKVIGWDLVLETGSRGWGRFIYYIYGGVVERGRYYVVLEVSGKVEVGCG